MSRWSWIWALVALGLGFAHQIAYRYVSLSLDPSLSVAVWLYGQALWGVFFSLASPLPIQTLTYVSRRGDLVLLAFRGCVAIAGQMFFFQAIRDSPLILTAYSSYIGLCTTTIGAMFILERRISWVVLLALTLTLSGVFFCTPQQSGLHASWMALGATLCFSVSSLLLKSVSARFSIFTIVFYLNFFMGIGFGMGLLGTDPSALLLYGRLDLWLATAGLAFLSLSLHLALTRSYQLAPLSHLAFVKTGKIPFAIGVDWLLYGRTLCLQEVLGGVAILLAIALLDRSQYIETIPGKIKRLVVRTMVLS